MPAKTVVCVICGKEVSKRSTRSREELGLGTGRACREHETVAKHVEIKELEDKERRQFERRMKETAEEAKKAKEKIQKKACIISAASGVRLIHTLEGTHPDLLYQRLRQSGAFTEDMIQEVQTEVSHLGGPLMSEEEISVIMMDVAILARKF